MYIRTDLAMESHELQLRRRKSETIPGISAKEYTVNGYNVTCVRVLNAEGADAIQKPVGTYTTVHLGPLHRREADAFTRGCDILSSQLRQLLPKDAGAVLVAGIGNPSITPDAVGPLAMRHILVTRHMIDYAPKQFGHFRPVSAVSPGVLGMTGIEVGELLLGICEKIRPDCVIAVDALASKSIHRLCTTVQLSDSGIVPGSGIGNARNAIDRSTLGIPVIAVGVPTVVDAATLVQDFLENTQIHGDVETLLPDAAHRMMVTTKEIDAQVADAAKLIGYSIDLALHEGMNVSDLDLYLS